MEERENKRLRLTGLRGVNLSCDQDTCQVLNGEFGGMASTRVEAQLCPNNISLLVTLL